MSEDIPNIPQPEISYSNETLIGAKQIASTLISCRNALEDGEEADTFLKQTRQELCTTQGIPEPLVIAVTTRMIAMEFLNLAETCPLKGDKRTALLSSMLVNLSTKFGLDPVELLTETERLKDMAAAKTK